LRKDFESRLFHPVVCGHLKKLSTRSYEALLKAREECRQCLLTAGEEYMQVIRLRRSRARQSIRRERVALKHHDLIEVVCEDTSRRHPCHACTDNQGLPAKMRSHPRLLRKASAQEEYCARFGKSLT
jgi:hypothetical protein